MKSETYVVYRGTGKRDEDTVSVVTVSAAEIERNPKLLLLLDANGEPVGSVTVSPDVHMRLLGE